MPDSQKQYPDNSSIFTRKAEGRRKRGTLSFAEKLAALDTLKKRAEPIARAREARKLGKLPPRPKPT
jgi:hypothetical protein